MGNVYYKDLIAKFQKALDEGWGYIINGAGQVWTEQKQANATDAMAIKYGAKWIGKRVADCSGLFCWAFKELGGEMYHGSNTMWRSWTVAKGKITANSELKPGYAVFKLRNETDYYHVGLYIGNGEVIEARGTASGVVKSKLSTWHYWAELKGVTRDKQTIETTVPTTSETSTPITDATPTHATIKWASKNDDVKILQTWLNQIGYTLKVDGTYGAKSMAAVMDFQQKHSLKADGIVGAKTWAALEIAVS